jgi:LmbE family N-acetylglucosaminyl deacetylase
MAFAYEASEVLVVAPHPDDETLGCAGVIQRYQENGNRVHWLIGTEMSPEAGYSDEQISARDKEIKLVTELLGFASVNRLGYPAATLGEVALRRLIQKMAKAFDEIQPNILYLPYPHDAHSDHRIVFEAAAACAKWFRRAALKRILCYEVPSETGFNLHPFATTFRPTTYVRLGQKHLNRKVEVMLEYREECGKFPFPRSPEAIRALARQRGTESGCEAAEAFLLLREYV